MIAGILEER